LQIFQAEFSLGLQRALMLDAIRTDRLLLRPLRVEDATDYHALETDIHVKQYLGGPSKLTVDQYRARIAEETPGLALALAITAADTGAFLGRVDSPSTLSFSKRLAGRSTSFCITTTGSTATAEVGRALLERGFMLLACDKILGVADAANTHSISLCSRLGMTFERDTRRYGRLAHIYSIAKNA
jgi:RimJ/RimL family protein N-acetyltransferase